MKKEKNERVIVASNNTRLVPSRVVSSFNDKESDYGTFGRTANKKMCSY